MSCNFEMFCECDENIKLVKNNGEIPRKETKFLRKCMKIVKKEMAFLILRPYGLIGLHF